MDLRVGMLRRNLDAPDHMPVLRMAQQEGGNVPSFAGAQRPGEIVDVARDAERLLALRAGFLVALAEPRLELLLRDVPEPRLRGRVGKVGVEREAIAAFDQRQD